MACSKHVLPATTAIVAAPTAAKIPIEVNLPGVWKLNKIEIPQMAEKMATFGNAEDKDKMNKTLNQYEDGLKGLTVTFNKDHSYTSVYNGQSDFGTWKLNEKNEVYAISKITDNTTIFEISNLTANTLQVKYTPADVTLLLTLIKN